MSAPVQDLLVQNFQQTNGRLRYWLDGLTVNPLRPEPVLPKQISGLLSELLQAGEWLRAGLPTERKPELEHEVREYRGHVLRLKGLLPQIHTQLLLERARLEGERARVEAASQWARAQRQAL